MNIPGQQPGQDLPEPTIPGQTGDDAVGIPDGVPGVGNDMPTKPLDPNPANEPDPTTPSPAIPGVPGNL